jgi:hypothetical protein
VGRENEKEGKAMKTNNPVTIHLSEADRAIGALQKEFFDFCINGLKVSMQYQNHKPGIKLPLKGFSESDLELKWTVLENTRGWGDIDYATEFGAYGMAFVIVELMANYVVFDSAPKGKGFDFWLIHKSQLDKLDEIDDLDFLSNKELKIVRMEVSGTQNKKLATSRRKDKLAQTRKSDHLGLPACIVITDFESPTTSLDMRHGIS